MLKSLIFTTLVMPLVALANPSGLFEQTIKKYQNAKLVSMKVEKVVTSELLGKETKYKGQIQLSSGKFRWENSEPEQTLLLFDGTTLFNVQFPPKEFKGPVQVAKSRIDQKTRKQILVSSLLSPSSAKSKFKVLSEKKDGNIAEVNLRPDGEDLQINDLVMKIDSKNKKINEISYKDDVGNLTKMAFSDVKFSSKADPKTFKYKIPKDAQVTNL